jgi:lysophospholipase L1-like esterase
MVMALAGFVTAGALPAAAAPSTVDYVALGDSYAAGTAAAGSPPNCPHGDDGGYPALLADGAESRIDLTTNAACSGATTSDVADDEDGQLSALKSDTRLVTLTVGAADLGLSRALAACANPQTPDACRAEIVRAQLLLRDCPEDEHSVDCSLTPLYAQVAREARGARIVVTGYPLLFESPLANDFPFSAINQATTRLNSLIERAVTATQATYANIYYVDVTKEFAGHGIVTPIADPDDPDVFIHSQFTCDPTTRPDCADPEAFHPTTAGYIAYADAISAALPSGWLDQP